MAEPTCKECGGHNFGAKRIQDAECGYVYIIFCKDCGWIAGCGGAGR